MVECKFSLELTKNGIQKSVHAKAGESESRKLVVTLTESGKIFELSGLNARVYLEDGKYIDEGVSIVGNTVEFILPAALIAGEGIRFFEIKIFRDEAILYSPMVELIVEKSLGNIAEAEALGEKLQYQELIAATKLKENSEMSDEDSIVIFDVASGTVMRLTWAQLREIHNAADTHTIGMVSGLREFLDTMALKYNEFGQAFANRDKIFADYVEKANEQTLALKKKAHTHSNKEVIDKFSVTDNKILFDGKPIESGNSTGSGLPAVSESDNGKFLIVDNGAWAAVAVPSAEEAVF